MVDDASEWRTYLWALAALLAAQVVAIWTIPVFPGQDVPQHLAYSRILLDHHRPELPLQEFYLLPARFQTYFTTHYLLAGLARWLGIEGGFRLLMSLHAAGMLLAFDRLVSAIAPRPGVPSWSALLAVLLVYNPIVAMGFLPFALAVPLVLWGAACLFRLGEDRGRPGEVPCLALTTAIACGLHLVAGASLLLLALVYALVTPGVRRRLGLAVVAAVVVAVALGTGLLEQVAGGAAARLDVAEAARRATGLEIVDQLLKVTWTDLPMRLNHVLWTVLGPYRFPALLVRGALLGLFVVLLRKSRPAGGERTAAPRAVRRAVVAFGIVCWFSPWRVELGDELAFLDLRLITLGVALLLVTIDPGWFRSPRARALLIALCAASTVHFWISALGFSRETRVPLAMLEPLGPRAVVLPVVLGGKSAYFGQLFRVGYFVPLLQTTRHGGISTQFWARSTAHLPIAYRAGKEPAHPDLWKPWELRAEHLRDVDYVLVQWAGAEEPGALQRTSETLRDNLERNTERVSCESRWCLYRTARVAE